MCAYIQVQIRFEYKLNVSVIHSTCYQYCVIDFIDSVIYKVLSDNTVCNQYSIFIVPMLYFVHLSI